MNKNILANNNAIKHIDYTLQPIYYKWTKRKEMVNKHNSFILFQIHCYPIRAFCWRNMQVKVSMLLL